MDRNSAVGLTLIAALLLAYFYFFAPKPQPVEQPTVQNTPDTTQIVTPEEPEARLDSSVLAEQYGDLSSFATGTEETITVETEDLRLAFSTKGGIIKSAELSKYTSYQDYRATRKGKLEKSSPLRLISPERTSFSLETNYKGRNVDLYKLFYRVEKSTSGDSTVVRFTLPLSSSAFISHTYTIPPRGHQVRYRIEQRGLDQDIAGENLTFVWKDAIQPLEKDLTDTRIYSTINVYSPVSGFDHLSERSTDTEMEVYTDPINWMAIKQKFFLAAIVSRGNFSGAEIMTTVPADTSVVKHASAKLLLSRAAIADGKEAFTYYIGPNDYHEIGDVAEDFRRNIYLGWPPVSWINKYVVFPVFHLLTQGINNYGLIIIILVILLKLVLFPLSYKSYLSMAKMKVLKPELDEIKAKHGDDMTKIQQEQLKLYQQVGVNPISGCIPVLLQMPILFAMFYLFPASIELRQQPFLWAEDLSTYDSVINLPFAIPFGVGDHISLFTLIMTVSTLVYTWQNNQLSSVQGPMKSMSYIMPLIFFFVLNSFSAGLTFYYFVSNLVTFGQQAFIRRFVDDEKIKKILEENRRRIAAGGGKKSRFMSKIQEAMKASEEAQRRAEENKRRAEEKKKKRR